MLKKNMESFLNCAPMEKIKEKLKNEKYAKVILIISVIALVLIVVVSNMFNDAKKSTKEAEEIKIPKSQSLFDETLYEKDIESRLSNLIESVEGVGNCKVMVTLEKGEYKIFAKDSYDADSENKDEYVILKEKDGNDTGLVLNVVLPVIKGVAVVCEGGDSAVVRSEIVSIVTSVFSVNSTQVSVSKMK